MGNENISITWKFVLEILNERNIAEHGTEDKQCEKKKEKLILKFNWIRKQIEGDFIHPLLSIQQEELQKLPIANLEILVEHATCLKKRK
jgi:hypothetical protein